MAVKRKTFQGYLFQSEIQYKRAQREWEVIENIERTADLTDARIAMQIYNKALAGNTFQTVVGYAFLKGLRELVLEKGLADEQTLKPIVVYAQEAAGGVAETGESRKYRLLYEKDERDKRRFRIVIAFFFLLIVGILIITYQAQYSIFTYFSDYEAEIENRIINQYSEWEARLEEREANLKQ